MAQKLSATPTRVVPEDWDALRAAGFDDQGCLEVAHLVGLFNHLTRLADGFGLVVEPEKLEAAETGVALTRQRPAG